MAFDDKAYSSGDSQPFDTVGEGMRVFNIFAFDTYVRLSKRKNWEISSTKFWTSRVKSSKTGKTLWEELCDRLTAKQLAEIESRIQEHIDEKARKDKEERNRREELREKEIAETFRTGHLNAGRLFTDLRIASKNRTITGRDYGMEIDDPSRIYTDGRCFSDTVRSKVGRLKIQLTNSLDLSNSMGLNGVRESALAAFRNNHIAGKELVRKFPDSFRFSSFVFARGEGGSGSEIVKEDPNLGKLHEMQGFLSENKYMFNGTGTKISHLFQNIQYWENGFPSIAGWVRLDIVITDAVFTDQKDLQNANHIQLERGANVTTVLANFVPSSDWSSNPIPKRCHMIAVTREEIEFQLRNLLGRFVRTKV